MQKEDTKFSAQGGPASGWDVAVIGAGPAGIMAAIQAARNNLRVILIEKNSTLAKKLLLTGGGRCNLTNAEFNLKELVKNYNNGEFLFHAFSIFGPEQIIKFFEELGVKTKIEKNKKVFPSSEDAGEVLEALKKYLAENKVESIFNSEVVDIAYKGKKINKIILKDREITAKKIILATGGKSHSSTGSNGAGYRLAEKLGHTIVKTLPALSPIMIKEEWIKKLQGISLKDININVFKNNKKQFSEEGELIFTHFGISGPTVLDISGRIGDLLEIGDPSTGSGQVKIFLDLFPILNQEELLKGLEDILRKYPNKSIKNILAEFVPERLAEVLLGVADIDGNKIANNMSKIERGAVTKALKNFEFTVEDVFGFDQAMVTRGGISLKEIDHKTMKSKIIDNLFFAGEIIDVDGKTGGFNLQMCWSTGYLAGKTTFGVPLGLEVVF
jgi:predicted Rossmann fold flavoprotein